MRSSATNSTTDARHDARIIAGILLALFVGGIAGCRGPREAARHYTLRGEVAAVDPSHGSLIVKGEAIPGFMDAMTMPYDVPDSTALASLDAGDAITADLVVTGNAEHLENIAVTKKGAGNASAFPKMPHEPQPGEKVPDFTLINQDGKRIRFSSFRGNALLVTFIYTRCPFPDFCPLVSKNFAEIYAATRGPSPLGPKIRLLSLSFDPEHDTPEALRRYGASFSQITGGDPFDRWEFDAVPPKELAAVARFFGLYYTPDSGLITHSLSTSVISPNGAIFKWHSGNEWTPAQLIAEAGEALEQEGKAARTQNTANNR